MEPDTVTGRFEGYEFFYRYAVPTYVLRNDSCGKGSKKGGSSEGWEKI